MSDQTTQRLAHFTHDTVIDDLPADVQHEAVRSFVNWVGCTMSGAQHPATQIAMQVSSEFAGGPAATLLGQGRRLDVLNTAFINCLASSVYGFNDTHLATVIHPAGSVAATLLALAERMADRGESLSGAHFQLALTLGIEVSCQLGVALLSPPAQGELGWYMTGVTSGMGAAAAAARVLGLSHEQTCWALGIAGNQASGYRQTHGTMCTSFVPAHAARCGLHAALLAQAGFTASLNAIEGVNGYAQLFSVAPHLDVITRQLGQVWEIRENTYKPYPSGIVIHPVIDAALTLHHSSGFALDAIERVDIEVNPLCLTLCDRPAPKAGQDAKVSVQHWAAAGLVRGKAGLAEVSDASVVDPHIVALRARVNARAAEDIERDGARVTLTLRDGITVTETVAHASGSLEHPMSDTALGEKFIGQAQMVLQPASARVLLEQCWRLPQLGDVARLAALTLPA